MGRSLLVNALGFMTSASLVARTGKAFTKAAVSAWATGVRQPTRYRDRAALARELGIPLDSWEQPAISTTVDETAGNTRIEMQAISVSVQIPRETAARIEAAGNGSATAATILKLIDQGLDVIEHAKGPHRAA